MEVTSENEAIKRMSTGTTTVGIKVKDAVILFADKRVTMGNYILSREISKIIPIANHLAITLSGAVGDNQLLARWLSIEAEVYEREQNKPMPPKAAVTLLANILSSSRYFPYWVMNLLAGYDYTEKKPYLFSIDLIGGITEEKIASSGSGSLIAFGILDEGYKEDMTIEEAINLGLKAVNAAMKRDSASGDGIDIFVITKNGGKFLEPEKLNEGERSKEKSKKKK
jgi:proteasome beta subunit